MTLPEDSILLRIFVSEKDKHDGKPVYELIIMKARELGLAGATAVRGIMSFGATSRKIHSAKLLDISDDLPVIVEIVDTQENLEKLRPFMTEVMGGGLVTAEKVKVLHYNHGN